MFRGVGTRYTPIVGYVGAVITITAIIGTISIGTGAIPGPIAIMCQNSASN